MRKKTLKNIIRDPSVLIESLNSKGYLSWIPDKYMLKWLFKNRIGHKLDLTNPQTFNEKIQWLKLYNRDSRYTQLVDKLEVRKFIKENIEENILIPLYGVWDTVDEIDWEQLPNQFVLKCTHDSGGVVICKDKTKFDINLAKQKLNKYLSRNYYYAGREWPYKNVTPRIIAEKYLVDKEKDDLMDYKLMVFNGKVKYTLVASNRSSEFGMNADFFDYNWEHTTFGRPNKSFNKNKITKPSNYDKMIYYAERLSKNIPFVRVDFYEVEKKLFFGEITFYPASGFEKFDPEHYDLFLGNQMNLSKKYIE